MDALAEIREGMAVFEPNGRRVGFVEDLREGHFFLSYRPLVPLVTERIVVDAESVDHVDAEGLHLRHNREELLQGQMRPPELTSFHQVEPGEDPARVRHGDEEARPLDPNHPRAERTAADGQHTGSSPMNAGTP